MSYTRNRAIALAVCDGPMTTSQAATHFHVSTRHVRRITAAYRAGGLSALEPGSKRPHTNPHATPQNVIDEIIRLRHALTRDGLDAGPSTIYDHLEEATRPSLATIWRILKRHGLIDPHPHKRPKSSYQRFQADLPNETWQSDFTHWPLAEGTDTEIISWMDDHSRYLLHVSAHPRVTGPVVVDTFTTTANLYGLPASTLTDNGMVYTTRLAGGRHHHNHQPNAFEQLLAQLGIRQKNGRPGHPTTQGKIERYHQTLKRWLHAQPAPRSLEDLNHLLADFQTIYNQQRKHRALGRRTPHAVYHATEKATPTLTHRDQDWRVRLDTVDQDGKITLRYAGKLRHLGIGRANARTSVIALAHGADVIVIHTTTGEILGEYTINPDKNYQPKKRTYDARQSPSQADT